MSRFIARSIENLKLWCRKTDKLTSDRIHTTHLPGKNISPKLRGNQILFKIMQKPSNFQ